MSKKKKYQPKRDKCPECGKKGLGVYKEKLSGKASIRECRYCPYFEVRSGFRVETNQET